MLNKVYQNYGKRFFDFIVSLLLLIFLSPLFLLISFFIKITSAGPVFFRQKRQGGNKTVFTMYKFRTMILQAKDLQKKYQSLNEADGPVFKIKNDPRLTKIGKTIRKKGLDELPQLINVLKGEMSLVGPRPLPVKEVKEIPEKWQKRHQIKPGIFSPWTASGCQHQSFSKWMKSDIRYLENISYKKDLKIILRTIKWLLA